MLFRVIQELFWDAGYNIVSDDNLFKRRLRSLMDSSCDVVADCLSSLNVLRDFARVEAICDNMYQLECSGRRKTVPIVSPIGE